MTKEEVLWPCGSIFLVMPQLTKTMHWRWNVPEGFPASRAGPADCDCLLLPGGGDMESWRYGQKNTAGRDLEPERDALELDLLADFTALGKPVLGICRGMQSINVFFGGDLVQDWPGAQRHRRR